MGLNSFFFQTRFSRPKVHFAPFVGFQIIPVLTLPVWFFLFLFFDTGARPVSERNVSPTVYLLFATQWFVPLFLVCGSAAMWIAVALRFRQAAWSAAIALCLPLAAILGLLLMQYLASVS
ncbi:MAG: hypothetical protein ABJL33_15335 [Hyphomicrobiales bacterium]